MKRKDLPDDFAEFVTRKYANAKGYVYDFFGQEWHMDCTTCGDTVYAPNKKALIKNRLYHTQNICLGGY